MAYGYHECLNKLYLYSPCISNFLLFKFSELLLITKNEFEN